MARITVRHDLDKLARQMRKAAASVPKETDAGLIRAAAVVEKKIRGSTDDYMPRGYEQVFKRSLVIKSELRGRDPRKVSMIVRAFGRRGNDRQVDQLERGRIKHKFWGRWVNVPQAWQKIKPRFVGEPADRATPQAIKEMQKAADKIADTAEGR